MAERRNHAKQICFCTFSRHSGNQTDKPWHCFPSLSKMLPLETGLHGCTSACEHCEAFLRWKQECGLPTGDGSPFEAPPAQNASTEHSSEECLSVETHSAP